MQKKTQKRIATVDDLVLDATNLPDGWTVETGAGWHDGIEHWAAGKYGVDPDARYAKFDRTDGDLHATIAFTVVPVKRGDTWQREHSYRGAVVEGQTCYNGRSFTRRGIDVSSCTLVDKAEYDHDYADLASLLTGEWDRCVQAFERSKTMVAVPGLPGGWKVTPERKQQLAEQLKAGKTATFTPHGMGVGYAVTGRRGAPRWAKPLPAETSAFFGVENSLYYTELDCD